MGVVIPKAKIHAGRLSLPGLAGTHPGSGQVPMDHPEHQVIIKVIKGSKKQPFAFRMEGGLNELIPIVFDGLPQGLVETIGG